MIKLFKKVICILGIFFSLVVFHETSYAYSIADYVRDNPSAKVVTKTSYDEAGKLVPIKRAFILNIMYDYGGPTDQMSYYPSPFDYGCFITLNEIAGNKSVTLEFKYYGKSWLNYHILSLGDGENSVKISPMSPPNRYVSSRSVNEDLIFAIDGTNYDSFANAIMIRLYGENIYTHIRFDREKYLKAMKVIQRFLWEK